MRLLRQVALLAASVFWLAVLCPAEGKAADLSVMEELEFTEIQDAVNEVLDGGLQFEDTVRELITGEKSFTLEEIVTAAVRQMEGNWKTEKQILLSILVLGIAAALLSNFSSVFQNQQIAEVSFEITYLLLFLILLQVFSGAADVAEEVLAGMMEFMTALVPSYFLAVTLVSGGTTAVVFYQFLLGLIYLLEWLIRYGLMPLIQAQMILVFVNHLTREEYLSQLSEMVTRVTGWILKSMLALVVGFNAIQGILNPAIDTLKATVFSRTAEMIPGIGNLAGGVADIVLGSAVLIKNGIGVAALVVIAGICLTPMAKLGILILLLELSAALIQPVSDKRMVGCVAGVGGSVKLLFQMVLTTAILFMLTIVVVTVSTGRTG